MAMREDIQSDYDVDTFLSDFVLADRRIAEWKSLTVFCPWNAHRDWHHLESAKTIIFADTVSGEVGVPDVITDETIEASLQLAFRDGEAGQVLGQSPSTQARSEQWRVLLLASIAFALHYSWPSLQRSVTIQLRHVRESLRFKGSDVAERMEASQERLSQWENGRGLPSNSELYQWCHALGLVCPPKSALVRVVDFSPELLHFLQEDPTRLRSLTPDEFERFIAERLDRMGYSVTLTGVTNRKDGGIDLIAVPKSANVGSIVIAGQVKHHRGDQKTGREAVDRLLAWKESYFSVGLLVTNTSFTHDAVWTAQQDRNARFLRLRGFTALKRWLQDQWGTEEDWREIPDRIELAPGVVIEIPRPRITSVFEDQGILRNAGRSPKK